MTKYLTYLLVAIVCFALAIIFLETPSGVNQKLLDRDKQHQNQIDSMKVLITKSDSAGYFGYKYCQEGFNKLVGEMRYWKNKARKCEQGQ